MNDFMEFSNIPDEIKQQIAILDESKRYVLIILVGIILSYYSLYLQREQLVCSVTNCNEKYPNTTYIRIISNLLVTTSLIFFYNLATAALNTQSSTPQDASSNRLNYIASLFVLIASLIRLVDLIFNKLNSTTTL